MYFVDRNEIRETLVYTNKLLETFDKTMTIDSMPDKLSLERMVQMVIESILDVGNMMIDGFIMRDPGSYEDIVDILIDEKVLPEQDESKYKALIKLRQMVVQDYLVVDHELLRSTMVESEKALQQFSSHVIKYLDNELGVAHAFSNEQTKK